jgi:hypothetical protein
MMEQNYQNPETKVLEILVEQCILTSSMEDPIENPEQDW